MVRSHFDQAVRAGDLKRGDARHLANSIDTAERLADHGLERVAALILFIASFKADDAEALQEAMLDLAHELS